MGLGQLGAGVLSADLVDDRYRVITPNDLVASVHDAADEVVVIASCRSVEMAMEAKNTLKWWVNPPFAHQCRAGLKPSAVRVGQVSYSAIEPWPFL